MDKQAGRFMYLEKEIIFTDSLIKCFTLQSLENISLLWIKSLCFQARMGSLATPGNTKLLSENLIGKNKHEKGEFLKPSRHLE